MVINQVCKNQLIQSTAIVQRALLNDKVFFFFSKFLSASEVNDHVTVGEVIVVTTGIKPRS